MPIDEFYRVVGRPDYADRYNAYRRNGTIWMVGGTLAGLGIAAYEFSRSTDTGSSQETFFLAGMTVAAVAFVGGLFGYRAASQSEQTNIALAEAYNRKLRLDLRIPDSVSQRERTLPTYSRRIALMPVAGPAGGGLSLAGSF